MATTLDDAVIRLRLDLEGAKKDAVKIREERDGAIGKDAPPPTTAPVDTKPGGSEPSPGRRGPGGGSSGRRTPGLAPSDERTETDRRVKKTEKAVSRLRTGGVLRGIVATAATIPVLELGATGLGAAMLASRFGPGLLSGAAGRAAFHTAGGGEAGRVAENLARQGMEPIEERVEALATLVDEFKSMLSAALALRGQIGAEMVTRGLVSDSPSSDGLAGIGAAYYKVNMALARARKRSEFLERRALNEGFGVVGVDLANHLGKILSLGMSN